MSSEPSTYQDYLLNEQYKNDQNLRARVRIHMLFSTNKDDFHRWVFDHFVIPEQARVLELGCGPGYLWFKNQDRLPTGWEITLSDFSPGMIEKAQANLQKSNHPFLFARIDAQSIPYEDGHFDAVIANHMLYHVPDIPKALAEVRRVLKPGGHFYAATNGHRHMAEVRDLIDQFDADAGSLWKLLSISSFRLENGKQLLSQQFAHVSLHLFEDALEITEAEPLVTYVLSTPVRQSFDEEKVRRFTDFIQRRIDEHGAIHVAKATGLFESW